MRRLAACARLPHKGNEFVDIAPLPEKNPGALLRKDGVGVCFGLGARQRGSASPGVAVRTPLLGSCRRSIASSVPFASDCDLRRLGTPLWHQRLESLRPDAQAVLDRLVEPGAEPFFGPFFVCGLSPKAKRAIARNVEFAMQVQLRSRLLIVTARE